MKHLGFLRHAVFNIVCLFLVLTYIFLERKDFIRTPWNLPRSALELEGIKCKSFFPTQWNNGLLSERQGSA